MRRVAGVPAYIAAAAHADRGSAWGRWLPAGGPRVVGGLAGAYRGSVKAIKLMFRGASYLLALMGAAFGGFPPPRIFERDPEPEEVLERVVQAPELGELQGEVARYGLVVTRRSMLVRAPEADRRRR